MVSYEVQRYGLACHRKEGKEEIHNFGDPFTERKRERERKGDVA
jgi:hypothetical protein